MVLLKKEEKENIPEINYDLNPFLESRLSKNPDNANYFSFDEEKAESFEMIVKDLFRSIEVKSDKDPANVLSDAENYLKKQKISENDINLILGLIEGGLKIAHDAIKLKPEIIKELKAQIVELEEELKEYDDDPENAKEVQNDIQLVQGRLDDLNDPASFMQIISFLRRAELLQVEEREAGENEQILIQSKVAGQPDDLRRIFQAKLAQVLELSPEEVVKASREVKKEAA
jgi:hypothetical protein